MLKLIRSKVVRPKSLVKRFVADVNRPATTARPYINEDTLKRYNRRLDLLLPKRSSSTNPKTITKKAFIDRQALNYYKAAAEQCAYIAGKAILSGRTGKYNIITAAPEEVYIGPAKDIKIQVKDSPDTPTEVSSFCKPKGVKNPEARCSLTHISLMSQKDLQTEFSQPINRFDYRLLQSQSSNEGTKKEGNQSRAQIQRNFNIPNPNRSVASATWKIINDMYDRGKSNCVKKPDRKDNKLGSVINETNVPKYHVKFDTESTRKKGKDETTLHIPLLSKKTLKPFKNVFIVHDSEGATSHTVTPEKVKELIDNKFKLWRKKNSIRTLGTFRRSRDLKNRYPWKNIDIQSNRPLSPEL